MEDDTRQHGAAARARERVRLSDPLSKLDITAPNPDIELACVEAIDVGR